MVIGTSMAFCWRFWAVTTTSEIWPEAIWFVVSEDGGFGWPRVSGGPFADTPGAEASGASAPPVRAQAGADSRAVKPAPTSSAERVVRCVRMKLPPTLA